MVEEAIQATSKNASVKRAYAERFFTHEEGKGSEPQGLIDRHEQWLKGKLEEFRVPVDDRTWNHFYDNALACNLGKKVFSLRLLERQVADSVGNILQALAWYHAPEGASWSSPKIYFKLNSPIFVNHQQIMETATTMAHGYRGRWLPPGTYKSYLQGRVGIGVSDKAPFLFRINEHYEGVQGWLDRNVENGILRGVRGSFDHETGIFQVSFGNPNEFMGWGKKSKNGLVYKLTELNLFLSDLTTSISEGKKEAIAVDIWRAY